MYNYDGKDYKIKSIIGEFDRDPRSKEIIICQDPKNKFIACDKKGRKVNSKGYLLDNKGNIVDRDGAVIWKSHELMYNEPPKIFDFT